MSSRSFVASSEIASTIWNLSAVTGGEGRVEDGVADVTDVLSVFPTQLGYAAVRIKSRSDSSAAVFYLRRVTGSFLDGAVDGTAVDGLAC